MRMEVSVASAIERIISEPKIKLFVEAAYAAGRVDEREQRSFSRGEIVGNVVRLLCDDDDCAKKCEAD